MSSVLRSPSRMKRICRLKRCMRSWLPTTFSAFSLSISSALQMSQLNVIVAGVNRRSTSSGRKDLWHCGQM